MPQHDNTPTDNRWKVGDHALCIMRKPWKGVNSRRPFPPELPQPVFGQTYKVVGVRFISGRLFLVLEGFPRAWAARFFIKATPSEDLIADEKTKNRTDKILATIPAKEMIIEQRS